VLFLDVQKNESKNMKVKQKLI